LKIFVALSISKFPCIVKDGRVAITQVANLLLCLYAKNTVPFGLLKAKAEAIAEYLDSPLKQIAAS
jgi:ragulator complex protein LAMTOR2